MLDVVRANMFVAEVLGVDLRYVDVPIIGGHVGITILPLLSQIKPPCSFTLKRSEYPSSTILTSWNLITAIAFSSSKDVFSELIVLDSKWSLCKFLHV